MGRPLADVRADIATTAHRLKALRAELANARRARVAAIRADWYGTESTANLLRKWGVNRNQLASMAYSEGWRPRSVRAPMGRHRKIPDERMAGLERDYRNDPAHLVLIGARHGISSVGISRYASRFGWQRMSGAPT